MTKTVKWLFFLAWYLFRQKPKDFAGYLKMLERRRSPWWKFRPCVYHNDDDKQWEIWFEDESSYGESRLWNVTVHVGQESGRVTGVLVCDEALVAKKPCTTTTV